MQFKQIEGSVPKTDFASLKAEIEQLKTEYPVKGWNGNVAVPFANGEPITSFDGIKLQPWTGKAEKADEKDATGSYFVAIFNGKEVPLKTFTKMKGVLTPDGKTEIYKAEKGLAEELRKHDFDDTGLKWLYSFLPTLPTVEAKFYAEYHTSVKGGYPHEVGVYNILW